MTLLFDLGNTRLKAALGQADGSFRMLGEAVHREHGMAAALAGALAGLEPGGMTALAANVAGPGAGAALASALRAAGSGELAFLRAGPEACGVRCAYAEPGRLGADRWAALIGARAMTGEACLVVDAGSALTIDALAEDGRHLGGWIIPGLAMMVAALDARTGDLARFRRASAAPADAAFPADTGPAMVGGALLAAAGAVLRARARLDQACGGDARLLLTGGDAEVLLAELGEGELVPDLVMRGLAHAAAGRAKLNDA
jgi:type III pantothenate kinase